MDHVQVRLEPEVQIRAYQRPAYVLAEWLSKQQLENNEWLQDGELPSDYETLWKPSGWMSWSQAQITMFPSPDSR